MLVLALRGVHTRLRPFKMVSRIVSLRCKSAHLEISPALSARCPQGFRVRPTRADAADRLSVTHFGTPRRYAFQQNVFQLAGLFCDRGRPSGTLSSTSAGNREPCRCGLTFAAHLPLRGVRNEIQTLRACGVSLLRHFYRRDTRRPRAGAIRRPRTRLTRRTRQTTSRRTRQTTVIV